MSTVIFNRLSRDFHYYYVDKNYLNYSEESSFPWSTTADDFKGLSVDIIKKKYPDECTVPTFALHAPNELPMGKLESKIKNISLKIFFFRH